MKLQTLGLIAAFAAALAGPAAAQQPAAPSPALSPASPSSASKPAAMAGPAAIVDINSASAADLDRLPGIGKARADAIIKNRPYKGKDDLVNRHIIPQSVYDGLKDKIVARQG